MESNIPTSKWQNIFRIFLGTAMILAALGHLTFLRQEFQAQVPDWLPMGKDTVVILSGLVELFLGLSMIFWVKKKVYIGLALATFFVLIFPGNIAQYLNGIDAFGLDSDTDRLIRLFFQPILIGWALWSTGAWAAWRRRNEGSSDNKTSIHEFQANAINGKSVDLSKYKGQVLLIVNTATKCVFTPQFEGLEEIYNAYKDKGFTILGFPSNQFANQEPHDNATVSQTCKLNWGVNFPLFAKINVNGDDAHPVFKFLKRERSGFITEDIKWNFTKFLIDKNGRPIKRYSPFTPPNQLTKDIERLLDSNKPTMNQAKTA